MAFCVHRVGRWTHRSLQSGRQMVVGDRDDRVLFRVTSLGGVQPARVLGPPGEVEYSPRGIWEPLLALARVCAARIDTSC